MKMKILKRQTFSLTEIKVDGGRMLKRLRPAPQGRAHRIRKRSNHVTIILRIKFIKSIKWDKKQIQLVIVWESSEDGTQTGMVEGTMEIKLRRMKKSESIFMRDYQRQCFKCNH